MLPDRSESERERSPTHLAALAAAQRAAGGIVVERGYPLLGRALVPELTIGAFAGVLGFVAPVREEVLAFLVSKGWVGIIVLGMGWMNM